ncbi:hypothetical protein CHLNCDRAFT_140708 [Chlorella variabilis]|uniref:MHD domain-containing protein n=1 Tax=Chlorella variabilis TaxID=554065 RepID=E1Z611_CHLVA|nr:hypothetical protein CHLNCDRAFT_140708 [Chlorella variabilis]EFN58567.1 hypothetical protein CHLNCDRAFT_140708 [Chlorella variabilis]|eukprot:XP_005850669.1 hypothetical protein CHLNCDRAFT_140708 [Chlorella variabilis]
MEWEPVDELFGYPLPFPREDLYIALAAVAGFIPAVVLINAVVNGIITLVSFGKKSSAEVFFRKAKFWDGEGRDAPPAFHVDGVQYLHVKIKSYLSGNPPIRLGLSESLVLGRRDSRLYSAYGSDTGEARRSLCSAAGLGVTLYLRLLAEYPAAKTATGVEVTVPLPRSVQRVHCEAGEGVQAARAEWRERERKLVWSIKNLKGGREHTLRCRLTVDPGTVESTKRDYGPIMVQFVLPGKPSASGLDVRYMKILKEEKNYAPSRWFRVVAMANSYQIRPH